MQSRAPEPEYAPEVKTVSSKNLSLFKEKCDERYAKNTDLPVANPTGSGTQILTSLKINGEIYAVPSNSVEFMTSEEIDSLFN